MRKNSSAPADAGRRTRRSRGPAAVLATTLGALAAAGIATAPAADAKRAAAHTVWDRVAGCESANRWHVNTGNGFYGGLQFTRHTWHSFGGGRYAGRADHASRDEQIEVARRVLHKQGRGAWPSCGPRAGLTRRNGHATGTRVPAKASPPPGQKRNPH